MDWFEGETWRDSFKIWSFTLRSCLMDLNSARMFSSALSISAYMDFNVANSESTVGSGVVVIGCG